MAKRGPKPKPTALRVLNGNAGRRPLNGKEPSPQKGAPTCPSFLEREGKAEWKRITKELEAMGLLYKVDRAMLTMYCEAWQEFKHALAMIRACGEIVMNEKGGVYQHPWVSIKNKAAQRLVRLADHFGLSPSARTRIKAEEEQEEDPLQRLLNKQSGKKGA